MDPLLNTPWATYRLWACTARYQRKEIDKLTNRSLWLASAGAIVAAGAEQMKAWHNLSDVAKVLGVVATGAVALATYFSRQAQADNRIGIWTRSRTAAESMKSCILLYRAGAAPFDGPDKAAQISSRTAKVNDDMHGVEPRQPGEEPAADLTPLTVDSYITTRLVEQIDWYKKRAREHQTEADRYRGATSVLMAIGAVLTVASALSSVSLWAPVVATLASSITAHVKNQQLQMLTATYTKTALQLSSLLDRWRASGKTDGDKAERDAFLENCEQTMATENGGWSALWAKA
jgi:hypothetical protein